jgi:hypothetical protein
MSTFLAGSSQSYRFITPGYLRALGVPLLKGRQLSARDEDRHVALISRSFADEFPHGTRPVGSDVFVAYISSLRDSLNGVWSANRRPTRILALSCRRASDTVLPT